MLSDHIWTMVMCMQLAAPSSAHALTQAIHNILHSTSIAVDWWTCDFSDRNVATIIQDACYRLSKYV